MNKEYSNIKPLIEKEENHLHNILPQEDVAEFKNMVGELREQQNTGNVLENKMFF